MSGLSVVIAAKNEAAVIERCLASVAFADELVVVDDASADDTAARAERCGARVVVRASGGDFHANKNLGLDLAEGPWLLSLDADEVVTPELAAELREAIVRPGYEAYELDRHNYFLGRWIRGCGWSPDPLVRLFRKGITRWPSAIHDTPAVEPTVRLGRLHAPLLHYSYTSFEQYLDKFNRYTTRLAEQERAKGVRVSARNAPILFGAKPAYWFWRKYFWQKGFRDGGHGLFICLSSAATIAMTYAKLLQGQDSERE